MKRNTDPIFSFTDKLRSAVRTHRKLHLTSDEVAILLEPDIIDAINRHEAAAMRTTCELANANDNKGLGIIGSGCAQGQPLGTSAGKSLEQMDALSRGARQRALAEATLLTLRKKPEMP